VVRQIEFSEEMTAAIVSNRRRVPPFGLNGGAPGQVGRNWIERANGGTETMSGTGRADMSPGDVFVIETPGGGGFGEA
jgi:5-oxoprolinase (ATP-hydrolysing)